jgi:hypothetical protein
VSFAGRAQATTLTTWLREDDDAAPDGALRHAADGVKGYQREGHRRRETLDKVQTNARDVNGRRGVARVRSTAASTFPRRFDRQRRRMTLPVCRCSA